MFVSQIGLDPAGGLDSPRERRFWVHPTLAVHLSTGLGWSRPLGRVLCDNHVSERITWPVRKWGVWK